MSLYEAEEPLVPMASAPMPPRSWEAMLATWGELMARLAVIVGESGPPLDLEQLRAVLGRLHILTWTWMWGLLPCSEARKVAFEMGRAATLIDRWRSCVSEVEFRPDEGYPICLGYMIGPDDGRTTLETSAENARALPAGRAIGQRAEESLRVIARQLEDVLGEARARVRGHIPDVAKHVSLYGIGYDVGARGVLFRRGEARVILDDFLRWAGERRTCPETDSQIFARASDFAALAMASLPETGPWVMSSEDVARFLRLMAEGST